MIPETTPDIEFHRIAELGNGVLGQINAMREAGPVIWSKNSNAWVVTRHHDLVDAYSGRLPLSNVRYLPAFAAVPEAERAARFPQTMRTIGYWPVFTDPPLHTRLRKLLTRSFGRKVIEDLRPYVRQTVRAVLDRAGTRGEVEFVNEVARATTARVIMRLLGIPEETLPRLEEWSLAINVALGSAQSSPQALDDMERTVAEMTELFEHEIAIRRATPSQDFLSEMVTARDGADRLSDEEIIGVCVVVLIAGHDTTMNSMALGTVALVRHPQAREYLLGNPESLSNSIMELARFIAMSTMQPRVVSADFEWHGQQLRQGDYVLLMLAGGNRDPRVFPDPETLDMTRPTEMSLVFGTGIHHCIGHLLAKMQLGELLPELFRRFDVEILPDGIEFSPVLSQRGLTRLDVRLRQAVATPEHAA
jgi:pimeloyl-[acyl-carrier protein] synthase